ncbi:hypothetical protein AB7M29_003295 [Pseudomonas sp. F-14 TE3623]
MKRLPGPKDQKIKKSQASTAPTGVACIRVIAAVLDHVGAGEGCNLFGNPMQKQPYAQTKKSGLVPFFARPESCHDA